MAKGNDFIGLGASLGGILLTIIIILVIFAKEMMVSVLPSIVWGFVVLGIVLGLFMLKAKGK